MLVSVCSLLVAFPPAFPPELRTLLLHAVPTAPIPLPVDFLKIDGAFVRDITDDKLDRSMVKSINEIGHVMGKKTIAEYVENAEILSLLYEIGVDYAQGNVPDTGSDL